MADSVTEFLTARRARSRPLRTLVGLLCTGWQPLDELVRVSAVPRRTVEELLASFGQDIERDRGSWRVAPSKVNGYRNLATPPAEVPDDTLRPVFESYLAGVPSPARALDHVQADVDTMLRRARWLDETYHLPGAHLLCLGDHDLTALAACTRRPGLSATVVDVDDRLLAYIDAQAKAKGLDIRCLHADFRFGLPPAAVGSADLVFTDPPYTPEGMRLFLARAVESLRDPDGRIAVAYGYSERNPVLGLKTQQEILRLGLVFEAVLPGFNRYLGAQAVGSASDLYVLQQTARSSRLAEAAVREVVAGIYTHGPQSVESGAIPATAIADLLRLSTATALSSPSWTDPIRANGPTAYDLTADPGPWLARVLLAGPAFPIGALVTNTHPDVADQRGQLALKSLVAGKYTLTFHRSVGDGKHTVVIAQPTTNGVRGTILSRVHGKLENVWREALIATTPGLTKREAREQVAAAAPHAKDLDLRLIDLPLHRIQAVLSTVDKIQPGGDAQG
ncbi:bis-aminopropyl spermidine synthase family protein [Actinokineospora sp. NBRC 105648]|uniref:bis-aminopropyl spermidine synthase family protein n=1 Tax=Actinokineospora sp. NBRC 105648 TaxID=3032206 RepID=UPI0024A05A41|nr:bis-aminopropyl spermidine synthase family protein [Actinokineospora sp. NBRC 105648]GLZ38438.1 methyltransferase [Actinokineospora sp. NBRC 105648]